MFKKKKDKAKDGAEGAEGTEEAKEEAKPEGEAKEGGEGGEAAEGEEGAPKKGKKKLLIIVAAAVLLLGGGAAFMMMGGGGDEAGHEEAGHEEAAAEVCEKDAHGEEVCKPVGNGPTYYELPEFLVNLNTGGNRVSFLKMSVTLELKDAAAVATLEANKPRVLDTFNTYLRELRPQDVQGSAGIYRLRDELLTRVNGTVEEGLVKDILFSEIIVQ